MTRRSRTCWLSLCALVGLGLGGALSCTITKTGNPGNNDGEPMASMETLAKECGLDVSCAGGLATGDTSISGVQSIDSYFSSVVRFQVEADRLSSALGRELVTLRAIVGVESAADLGSALSARIAASTNGGLRVQADVPRCEIPRDVALAARNRCEGEVGASSEVECYGRCEQPPGAELGCDGTAELACTFMAGASACEGECKGRCTTEPLTAAVCAGVCRGSCSGACSLYSDPAATECAGRCDGMCTGSCEVEQVEGARCDGACTGECTVASTDGGCEGARSASCQAAPATFVVCAGRCEGEIGLSMVHAECEVVARAETKMSLQCSTPRVSIEYQVNPSLPPEERARFEVAMRILQQRLPALLVTLARAEETFNAGTDLIDGAAVIEAAARGASSRGVSLSRHFGLACAVKEADGISTVIEPAADRLSTSVTDVSALTSALGM